MTAAMIPFTPFPLQASIENLALANPHDRTLRLVGSIDGGERTGQGIVLYPGETSEILVRLHNVSEYDCWWYWSFGEDTSPELANWCEPPEMRQRIVAGESAEYPIALRLPADFFESPQAISQQPRLQLEYKLALIIYEVGNSIDPNKIAYQFFQVYLRPRVSFLDFLPAFYGESDFLARFLCIFEQGFQPYIDTIDALWAYLDPLTAPPALLPFLAHWVAWEIEPDWDVEQQRKLIRNAVELYRWHGTRYGLRFYLHLYTGLPLDEEHIAVDEEFEGGFTFGNCQIGQNALMGGGRGYHFMVRLRWDVTDENRESVRLLIERERPRIKKVIERAKPPFCNYDLDCDVRG
jgi:phage tail-like protein